ncbi:glycerol-3-phosphate dehydrogenase subunit C [Planctomycetaceae bacterium]|nr:glycerol-3-phosphate dehydrogenase subunit C [Planctomycetaceae bacterium]
MAESIGLKVNDPKFWDKGDLRAETDRIYDICNGCRLCFKFCDTFPTIFRGIDGISDQSRAAHLKAHPELLEVAKKKRAEAEARGETLPEGIESAEVMGDELPELSAHAKDLPESLREKALDECFQCKLCYPNCPYTPPHEFALDFPRLLLRQKAQRVRERGVSMTAKLLRNPDLIGKLSSSMPALMNFANKNPVNRLIMEWTVGIDRKKLLPEYHWQTFRRWWRKHKPKIEAALAPREGVEAKTPLKVALFSTCLVNWNDPGAGKAAVEVLEHNGIEVVWPQEQVCCGMPYLDEGDIDAAKISVERNAKLLLEYVKTGYEVVIMSPSCSLMIREEYPQILGTEDAKLLAAHSHDACDYLFKLKREGRIKRDFKFKFDKLKYHIPCHIKAQNIGLRGKDMLNMVAEDVDGVDACSGHDGTWSMKKKYHKDSLKWGGKLFDGIVGGDDREKTPRGQFGEACSGACGDCHLAATQVKEATGISMTHPLVALAMAYGFDVGKAAKHLKAKPVDATQG